MPRFLRLGSLVVAEDQVVCLLLDDAKLCTVDGQYGRYPAVTLVAAGDRTWSFAAGSPEAEALAWYACHPDRAHWTSSSIDLIKAHARERPPSPPAPGDPDPVVARSPAARPIRSFSEVYPMGPAEACSDVRGGVA